jgi:hypothetical protein
VNASTKRRIIYVATVAALALTIAFVANLGPIASREVKLTATSVEGEVLSVEVVNERNMPERKEAVVKLASGETVRAYVPPACVVFPGQWAELSRLDNEVVNVPFYVLKGPKEKNDS